MKILTCITVAMILCVAALAQDYEQIPLKDLTEIAHRNAQALWGDVYQAEPIPYYGQDDQIVAWRFNYSINKAFPNTEKLKAECIKYEQDGNAYKQYGNGEFGRILISARSNMAVIMEYATMLSPEFSHAGKFQNLSQREFGKSAIQIQKTYYLSHFDIWHKVSDGIATKYICVSPTGGIKDEQEFHHLKENSKMFCETGDFKQEWEKYQNGFAPVTDGDVLVPNYLLMPFIDWSYGCSPTSAMMILAYYNYRSMVTEYKYPNLVTNIFEREDGIQEDYDYTVCGTHRQLAIEMETDTVDEGTTYVWNLDNGMQRVTNHFNGYNFDIYNRYTTPWTRLKSEINAGRPAISNSYNKEHSYTAVGCNNGSDKIIVHNTWEYGLSWIDKTHADVITIVKPGGGKGHAIELVHPKGDTRYNKSGQGENFYAGDVDEIRWHTDCYGEGTVTIMLSTNGGHSWDEIAETENDNCYDWEIPSDLDSESCRILLWLMHDDYPGEVAGGDCSISNFIISPSGSLPIMSSNFTYTTYDISRYFQFEHTEPSWAVIGNQTVVPDQYWETQIYPDTEFNQTPLISSVCTKRTNFIVIDGNHAPNVMRGVKAQMALGDTTNHIQYEGGNNELTLTPGETTQINWGDNKMVKMYDIHLTPGQYYFKANRILGDIDIDMAFFSSTDGDYYKTVLDADYISENWGLSEDSFIVTISEEDDYGLCLFAKQMGAGTVGVKIDNAFIWTGNEDDNWHNGDNWVGGAVPPWGSDVAIPNRTNDPNIYEAEAHCEKLNILPGAKVILTNHNLVINGDLNLDGTIQVNNSDLYVYVGNDVSFNSNGNIGLVDGAQVQVNDDWTFEEGSSWYPSQGAIKFIGTGNSIIHVKSDQVSFHDLRISKTGGARVAYDNCPGMEQLRIEGQFIIDDGAEFIQWALHNTLFEGPFLAYPGSEFHFVNGQAIFNSYGTGGITINSEPGNYFNNLTSSCADWLGLSSDIEIRGNLLIEEGNFKTQGFDVYIQGDWNDEAWGFNHGSSRVIFNGTGTQTSYGGAFWELELNKPSGELRIRENTTGAQHYDWTQGTMRVNGGYFLAMDCEDDGIYGTVIVTSGTADFRQDPGQYFDMNANLEISGGELHLHGGNGMGYWPFSADASITMSDGLIDVHDYGIKIFNSTSYTLEENISGGLIRINGSLHVHRDDFNPTGGTFEFIGYNEDASLHSVEGANLFNVVVDKSSKKNKAIAANLVATGIIDINRDFTLNGGNFEAPETMSIYGQFINNQTSAHFDELSGIVIFDGPGNNEFYNDEVFYNLIVEKPSDMFIVNPGVLLGVNGTFTVEEGIAYFLPGSELTLGTALEINHGGTIGFEGTETDRVSVNHGTSKLNYAFDINPGGTIGAVYTTFIYMDIDGINLHSGAYTIPEGEFHHCNFAYGLPGGTAMTIDNGADMVIHNANFLPNTTGMTYNVTKNVDNGTVYFDEATGDFSGSDFEKDFFNRIHWEYIPPFDLPFQEDWSSGDLETNIWTKTGDNWIIDPDYGNDEPSAQFKWMPHLTNYSQQLRSFQLNGGPHEAISLSYDIAYEEYESGTLEQLTVRVVFPNGDYINVANYNNTAGTFDFVSETIDISEYAAGEIFMVSFVAHGENTFNIEKWNIDNIEVIGVVAEPGKLSGYVKDADNGNRIENALIEIIGTSFNQLTDNLGEFNIVDVPPGFYNVSVSADGYLTSIISSVEVKSEENTFLTIPLTPEPPIYCTELLYTNGCTEGDGLNTFILEEIVNEESGCSPDGYGDFTALSAKLSTHSIYPLQVSSNYANQHLSVWIDFDDDFNFDEDERLISDFIIETPDTIYNTGLEIPLGANPGIHRLRARTNWNQSSTNPCATYGYGETEDYAVEIVDEAATGGMVILVSGSQSKAPIENALVEIMGTNWYGYTEDEGYCIIDLIESGIYDIRISASGYEDIILPDQIIYAGQMAQMEASLTPALPLTQAINLKEGWQGLSSYLMPLNTDIENIFGQISNYITLAYNYDAMYWPDAGINTLNTWDQHNGFFIKMQGDATLNITGHAEADLSCDVPDSWSILPVICPDDVMLTELFDGKSVKSNLILIKEIAGTGVYWPQYNIHSLNALETSKAYLICMEQGDEIVFPEIAQKATASNLQFEYPKTERWNTPAKTASSHIVVFPENILTQLSAEGNCWIAAFTNEGLCCGMSEVDGSCAITLFGDDQATFEKDGFGQGEKLNFRIINLKTLHEQNLMVEFDESSPNPDQTFAVNGISIGKSAQLNATGIQVNLSGEISVYPNPTHGKISITGISSVSQLQLFNADGHQIITRDIATEHYNLDLRNLESGVYLIRIVSSNRIFTKRIVLF